MPAPLIVRAHPATGNFVFETFLFYRGRHERTNYFNHKLFKTFVKQNHRERLAGGSIWGTPPRGALASTDGADMLTGPADH